MPLPLKRSSLSIQKKIEILNIVDEKRLSKTEIANLFKIPKSTLFTIIKNRHALVKAAESGVSHDRLRARDCKYPMLEKVLIEWLKQMRSSNTPIYADVLTEKAQEFALKLKIFENFKASNGWFQKFKLRHGIVFQMQHKESDSVVDNETINDWKEWKLKGLLAEYNPDDVFNAGETGLFFKTLPDKTLAFKKYNCNGGKRAKQRLTVLLAANMSGSEKLPILIVGNAKKPCCFKGLESLPTTYKASNKAWMTANIFEEWVRQLDKTMQNKQRKILLFLDNSTAHPEIKDLKAVRIEFLPLYVAPMFQPLHQGIIYSFKLHYRKMLIKRIIFGIENKKPLMINLLEASQLANSAWQQVSQDTIANCFCHAGFSNLFQTSSTDTSDQPKDGTAVTTQKKDGEVENENNLLMDVLKDKMGLNKMVNFNEYVNIDKFLECSEDLSKDNCGITNAKDEISSSEDQQADCTDVKVKMSSSEDEQGHCSHAKVEMSSSEDEHGNCSDAKVEMSSSEDEHGNCSDVNVDMSSEDEQGQCSDVNVIISSEDEKEGFTGMSPRPTIKQASEAIQVVKNFFLSQENAQSSLLIATVLETRILKMDAEV